MDIIDGGFSTQALLLQHICAFYPIELTNMPPHHKIHKNITTLY